MNEKMDMRISGSSTMPGGEYDRVSISGSGTVQGDLRCQSLSCSGSARVQGDVDCAGEVRSSGGGSIRIYQPQQKSLLGLFRSSCSCAQAGDIEGDDVDLEYTQADVVRGRRVRIGEGCSIGRVEYSESLDALPGTVGEAVQTGE